MSRHDINIIIKLGRKEPDPYELYRALVKENSRADSMSLLRLLELENPRIRREGGARRSTRKRVVGG